MNTAAGLSDIGHRRGGNEDALYVDPAGFLFAVADGLGGHAAGEVASGLVVETLAADAREAGDWTYPARQLDAILRRADARVRRQADGPRAGMGATVVALWLGRGQAWVAHAGDSRAYRWRDGELACLTRDHTPEAGGRGQVGPRRSGMITNAVGVGDETWYDIDGADARAGDRFLLCSDGLSDMVPEAAIAALLCDAATPDAACRALVDAALAAGGLDNVTCVVVFAA